MESPWPEKNSGDRERAIKTLLQGREITTQLQNLLLRESPGMKDAEDLIAKISNLFTESLSILKDCSFIPAVSSPSFDRRPSEDSGESSRGGGASLKDRRGHHKRRKSPNSSTKIIPNLSDDGYAWRKYGQKEIRNTTHHRNYYKCTHNRDQGCKAKKQVQKTEDNPPRFMITREGHHTCRNLQQQSPQIIFDSTYDDLEDKKESFNLISFGSNILGNNNKIESEDDDHKLQSPNFTSLTGVSSSGDGDVMSEYLYWGNLSNDFMVEIGDFNGVQFEFPEMNNKLYSSI